MPATSPSGIVETLAVDGVPVLVHVPGRAARNGSRLAVWLPYLGGSKEVCTPTLERLTAAGFVAISVDPRLHGQRATEVPSALLETVMTTFRRSMWPILGGTTLDVIEVIDWALDRYDLAPQSVVVGGVSMGGDIAVAVAGADHRVERVAAIAATPDWTRPGMTRVGEPDAPIAQGQPTAYGRWLYERLDPLTHLDAYRCAPAIRFDVGAADTHVPADGAHRFHTALVEPQTGDTERIQVVDHEGLDHLGVVTNPAIIDAAVDWLATPTPL